MNPVIVPLVVFVLVFAATGLPLIILWRNRIQWKNTEAAMIPIPWLFWQLLSYPGILSAPGKTIVNLLVECAIMGFLAVPYILYRRFIHPGEPARLQFYGGAVAGLLVAFVLHRFLPTLGLVYG